MKNNKKYNRLVSIVVPTYNQSDCLLTTLEHIICQDYPNIEIIVVDDGSTDKTRSILAEFKKSIYKEKTWKVSGWKFKDRVYRINSRKVFKYPRNRRIITILKKKNVGPTKALNAGLKKASGYYFGFIASDNVILPRYISSLVEVIEVNNADFAYANTYITDDNLRILQHVKTPDYSFKGCFVGWYNMHGAFLYKRELHDKYGSFNENFRHCNDYETFSRFAIENARFVHLDKTLMVVRGHFSKKRRVGQHANERHKYRLKEAIICAERALRHHKKYGQ